MKKERLFVVVNVNNNNKISINCVKDFYNYEINKNDCFIFIREELLFNNEEGIKELNEYYEIPNMEDLVEANVNKVFYTPYLIKCNFDSIIEQENRNEIKKDLLELFDFYKKDTKEITLEEFTKIENEQKSEE